MPATRAWLPRATARNFPQPMCPGDTERGLLRTPKCGHRGRWPTQRSLSPPGQESLHPPWPQETANSLRVASTWPRSPQLAPGASAWCLAKPEVSGPRQAATREAPPGLHLVSLPGASSDTCTRPTRNLCGRNGSHSGLFPARHRGAPGKWALGGRSSAGGGWVHERRPRAWCQGTDCRVGCEWKGHDTNGMNRQQRV